MKIDEKYGDFQGVLFERNIKEKCYVQVKSMLSSCINMSKIEKDNIKKNIFLTYFYSLLMRNFMPIKQNQRDEKKLKSEIIL